MNLFKIIKLRFKLRKAIKEQERYVRQREDSLISHKESFDFCMSVHCENILREEKEKLKLLKSYKKQI